MKKYDNWRLLLTSECNARCFFCHKDGAENKGNLLDMKIIDNILLKYGKEIKKIRLAGGEPLLHPEIFNIIEKCSCHTKDIGLVTNGLLLKKYFNEIIKSNLSKITISLHVYNEDKYEKITKINKNFLKDLIITIKELTKYKKVKLNAVVIKNINTTKDELKKILNFCITNNLDIEFIELDLGSLEQIDFKKYHLSPEDLKSKIEKIFNIEMNYSDEESNYTYKINNSKIEIHKSLCYNKLCFNCLKSRPIIVYPNGEMNRCRMEKAVVDNVDIKA